MESIIYDFVEFTSKMHSMILSWNNGYEGTFTDKELHFWVIGLVGMGLLFVIYPLFMLMAKHHVLIIAWLYVFTLMVVIAFAIEIGQGYYGTGVMDFEDVVFGLKGFMMMFSIFAVIKVILSGIAKIFKSFTATEEAKA